MFSNKDVRFKNPELYQSNTENSTDYNKHTKPRIYPKTNFMCNTDLRSLLINVKLCKKCVTETVSGYRQYETVTVIAV